jgi:hypothetical protein
MEDKSLSPSTTPCQIVVKTGSNTINDIDFSTTDHRTKGKSFVHYYISSITI